MRCNFTKKLKKSYEYFRLPNGEADVFVYDLKSEQEEKQTYEAFAEETEAVEPSVSYSYEYNSFRISADDVTEEDVKANIEKYLKFKPGTAPTLEELAERVDIMENAVLDLALQKEGGTENG